jgi:hypothetical protein
LTNPWVLAGLAASYLNATGTNAFSTDETISLGILAAACVVALLILVMGYKNVTIKETKGSGASRSGTGSNAGKSGS